MPEVKSSRQISYLLGDRSPLTAAEKASLRTELRNGSVEIRSSTKRSRTSGRRSRRQLFQQ